MAERYFFLIVQRKQLIELLEAATSLLGKYDTQRLFTIDPREQLRLDFNIDEIHKLVDKHKAELYRLDDEIKLLVEQDNSG